MLHNSKYLSIFLGLAGYYCSCIKNLYGMFAALNLQISGNTIFEGTEYLTLAFKNLKEILIYPFERSFSDL